MLRSTMAGKLRPSAIPLSLAQGSGTDLNKRMYSSIPLYIHESAAIVSIPVGSINRVIPIRNHNTC